MRAGHAKECMYPVRYTTSRAACQLYDELIARSASQQLLADRLDAWLAQQHYVDEKIVLHSMLRGC